MPIIKKEFVSKNKWTLYAETCNEKMVSKWNDKK